MGAAREQDLPAHAAASDEALYTVVPKWLRIYALWFTGAERWQARAYAAAVVSLSLANSMFLVRISYAQRNFSTAMSEKDIPGFYKSVGEFAVIICIAAPLFSLNSFLEDRLVLSWRAYLTRVLLEAYFSNRSYFHLKQQAMVGTSDLQQPTPTDDATLPASHTPGLSRSDGSSSSGVGGVGSASATVDNPDQRICDDVGAFCRSSSSLTLALIKKVFNCAAFAGVLWSVSPTLVYFLFGYAIFGTFATTAVFGKVLTVLYFQLLAREGDMRFSLVRVREHAESIAFYAGGAQELRVVLGRLERVLSTTFNRIRWTALYDLPTRAAWHRHCAPGVLISTVWDHPQRVWTRRKCGSVGATPATPHTPRRAPLPGDIFALRAPSGQLHPSVARPDAPAVARPEPPHSGAQRLRKEQPATSTMRPLVGRLGVCDDAASSSAVLPAPGLVLHASDSSAKTLYTANTIWSSTDYNTYVTTIAFSYMLSGTFVILCIFMILFRHSLGGPTGELYHAGAVSNPSKPGTTSASGAGLPHIPPAEPMWPPPPQPQPSVAGGGNVQSSWPPASGGAAPGGGGASLGGGGGGGAWGAPRRADSDEL
ncbi:hypothetical protein FOA52_012134 [Chlamydomonas sp. UWO 241]|nr:hypothetical protein FOA52_012134 [Chlamydomonas sp. UWO 241]